MTLLSDKCVCKLPLNRIVFHAQNCPFFQSTMPSTLSTKHCSKTVPYQLFLSLNL